MCFAAVSSLSELDGPDAICTFFLQSSANDATANRKVPPIISQCGISMLPKLLAHGERHPSKKGLTDLFVLLLCVTKSLPKF